MNKLFNVLMLLAAMHLSAQSQPQQRDKYLGLNFQPQYAFLIYNVNEEPTAGYLDSLKELQTGRFAYSAGIVYSRGISDNWTLQTGLNFSETGFKRIYDSLYAGLILHPDVPIIEDNSQASGRNVEFNYRFRYLDIPVIFNHRIRSRKIDKNWDFYLTLGLTFQVLISHDQKVYFRGFSMDNEDRFVSNNTFLSARPFNIMSSMGARFDYKVYKDSRLSIQPLINIPLLPATTGNDVVRAINPGIQVSFYHDLNYRKEAGE